MGCNCKTSSEPSGFVVSAKNETSIGKIIKYVIKTLGFLLGLLLLPLIMLAIIWFMFDTIVLNKDVDLKNIIDKFVKFNNSSNEDYDEEEYDEDDLHALNVEDITNKRNK